MVYYCKCLIKDDLEDPLFWETPSWSSSVGFSLQSERWFSSSGSLAECIGCILVIQPDQENHLHVFDGIYHLKTSTNVDLSPNQFTMRFLLRKLVPPLSCPFNIDACAMKQEVNWPFTTALAETSKPWTSTHKCQVPGLLSNCWCLLSDSFFAVHCGRAPKEWDAMSRQIPTRSQRCLGDGMVEKFIPRPCCILLLTLHRSLLVEHVWESLKASNSFQTPLDSSYWLAHKILRYRPTFYAGIAQPSSAESTSVSRFPILALRLYMPNVLRVSLPWLDVWSFVQPMIVVYHCLLYPSWLFWYKLFLVIIWV